MPKVKVYKGDSAPTVVTEGLIWVDTTGATSAVKVRSNGSWVTLDSSVAEVLADLDTTEKGSLVAAINELRAEIHDTGTGLLDRVNELENP